MTSATRVSLNECIAQIDRLASDVQQLDEDGAFAALDFTRDVAANPRLDLLELVGLSGSRRMHRERADLIQQENSLGSDRK